MIASRPTTKPSYNKSLLARFVRAASSLNLTPALVKELANDWYRANHVEQRAMRYNGAREPKRLYAPLECTDDASSLFLGALGGNPLLDLLLVECPDLAQLSIVRAAKP